MSLDNQERILKKLEEAKEYWQEKLADLSKALCITDNTSKKFALKKEIFYLKTFNLNG